MVQPLWKIVWQYFNNLNLDLPYDPAIPVLGTYPKEPKTYVSMKICTRRFLAALFIIAKKWKTVQMPIS